MYETLTPKALCEALETDENNGLKDAEASHRLQRDGENILRKTKDRTIWDMIQEQINDPMILILFLACLLYTSSKAWKLVVRTLEALVPRITFRLKARKTPGIPLPAIWMAQRQFSTASASGFIIESWLPVMTTGIGIFSSRKDRAEDV